MGIIIVPILQMRKQRHGAVWYLVQGYTVRELMRWDFFQTYFLTVLVSLILNRYRKLVNSFPKETEWFRKKKRNETLLTTI